MLCFWPGHGTYRAYIRLLKTNKIIVRMQLWAELECVVDEAWANHVMHCVWWEKEEVYWLQECSVYPTTHAHWSATHYAAPELWFMDSHAFHDMKARSLKRHKPSSFSNWKAKIVSPCRPALNLEPVSVVYSSLRFVVCVVVWSFVCSGLWTIKMVDAWLFKGQWHSVMENAWKLSKKYNTDADHAPRPYANGDV